MTRHLAADVDSQLALCGRDAFPTVLVDRIQRAISPDFCVDCMNVYAGVGKVLVSASIRVRLKEQVRRQI